MKLNVNGMSCGGCVRSVEKILTKRGAENVEVSLEDASAQFDGTYEGQDLQDLIDALAKGGFEASPAV